MMLRFIAVVFQEGSGSSSSASASANRGNDMVNGRPFRAARQTEAAVTCRFHSWATDVDDPTVQPRWSKIGKQKIEDAGTLYPERMKTVHDKILANALKFTDKARADGKPFFLWLNPTRMHVVTHLSDHYEALRNAENGWSEEEAGMAQLDDIVGSVMKYVKTTVSTTTRSLHSRPTMVLKTSPGPTAGRHPSPEARERRLKAVSGFRRS
jgi:hypothetical protein